MRWVGLLRLCTPEPGRGHTERCAIFGFRAVCRADATDLPSFRPLCDSRLFVPTIYCRRRRLVIDVVVLGSSSSSPIFSFLAAPESSSQPAFVHQRNPDSPLNKVFVETLLVLDLIFKVAFKIRTPAKQSPPLPASIHHTAGLTRLLLRAGTNIISVRAARSRSFVY